MAIRIWDGDTDTDWDTATNWSGDTEPVDGDEVIFDGTQTTGPTTGMSDGESGDAGNGGHDLLHVKSTFTGNIGTAALPCTVAPTTLIIEGPGTFYFNCGEADQSTEATITDVIINNSSATVHLFSNANDAAAVCTYTNVYLTAGTLYAGYYDADTDNTGCYIANLYVAPQNNSAKAATVIIEKDAYNADDAVAMNITMQNGTLTTDSAVGTLTLFDGTVNYGSEPTTETTVTETGLDIAALYQFGGTFNWYPDDAGDPTIALAYLAAGVFDAGTATTYFNPDIAKTITTTWLNRGATMKINNGRGNITLTKLWNQDGTLTADTGAQIAVSYNTA